MYPHCLSEYHLCIDDQGNLSDPRCNRYCEYVGCNLCGRRCYGDCSFECNPGVVCKKSVEMILLVYSMRCCRTWGQTTDRKKAGWKFCSSPFRKCGHDFGDSSFPVANFVGTGKKILRRKSEKRAACE